MSDALIVGGGPAGAIAGIMLCRAGWDVKLVEQHRFPRDKVCGECLSALGISVLEQLSLASIVARNDPSILTHAVFHDARSACLSIDLPAPMWGLSRWALDELLLRQAGQCGVRVLQRHRCEKLENVDGQSSARIRDLASNFVDCISASCIVIADGKPAFVDPRAAVTLELGIKAHFTGVDGPAHAVEIFALPGCYAGLAPIEQDRWNLALSVPMRCVRDGCGGLDALLWGLVDQNIALARRLRRARRITPVLCSSLPRFAVTRSWTSGVIPLGNSAAACDPIGGEGMGLAMRSAQIACEMLIAAGDYSRLDREVLVQRFAKLWRTRRMGCRLLALAASHPPLANVALRVARACKPVAGAGLRLIGKT